MLFSIHWWRKSIIFVFDEFTRFLVERAPNSFFVGAIDVSINHSAAFKDCTGYRSRYKRAFLSEQQHNRRDDYT
ncbi:MAG: hypothetical protein ACXAEU_26475 [Candidatus Hodarchaeales archaeon]